VNRRSVDVISTVLSILVAGLPLSAAAQSRINSAPAALATSEVPQSSPPGDALCKPSLPGPGEFTVRGIVFQSGPSRNRADQVTVEVDRGGSERNPARSKTNSQGEYCVAFPGGSDIVRLLFQDDKGTSCIFQLSGNMNHIINKIMESSCPNPDEIHATQFYPAELPGKIVWQNFYVLNVGYGNNWNSDFMISNAILNRDKPCPAKLVTGNSTASEGGIPAADPELVALSTHRNGFALLRFGSVALFSVNRDANALALEYLLQRAFRPNQVVPRYTNSQMIMFFPKKPSGNKPSVSALPPESSLLIYGRSMSTVEGELTPSTVAVCQGVQLIEQ
jgi:hypothetical protein